MMSNGPFCGNLGYKNAVRDANNGVSGLCCFQEKQKFYKGFRYVILEQESVEAKHLLQWDSG